MRLYKCDISGMPLYFDSHSSVGANNAPVGFAPDTLTAHRLEEVGDGLFKIPGRPIKRWRYCANAPFDGSNWLVEADDPNPFAIPARYNRATPNTDSPEGINHFHKLGAAQRHLFYSILRFGLPCPGRREDAQTGLVFDFLEDKVGEDGTLIPAITAHENGLISLRAAEADDAVRESVRISMGEPYRTLLGHFRHEMGHFYFAQLVEKNHMLDEARMLFGDERKDYAEALKQNYEQGPPSDWQERFISTYASCHPSEDFAECWAHYFHIVDTLESVKSFGMSLEPLRHRSLDAELEFDPYASTSAEELVEVWVPISIALNTFQRSMGQRDMYPFVMPPPVVKKLDFINRLIARSRHNRKRARPAKSKN